MRAHSSGRVTSFVTERDGVRWCKILHLTRYDVSEAMRTNLVLVIFMSIVGASAKRLRKMTRVKPVLNGTFA
jgi:hypothetical protein